MKNVLIYSVLITLFACDQPYIKQGRKTVAGLSGNWKMTSITEYPAKSTFNNLLPSSVTIEFKPCENVYTKNGCQANVKINNNPAIDISFIAGVKGTTEAAKTSLSFIYNSELKLAKADSTFLSGWILEVVEDKKLTIQQRLSAPYYDMVLEKQ